MPTATRPQLPTLPPGRYAVPDPDHPDVTTFWWVPEEGGLKAWPPGRRWAPLPPNTPALPAPERAARRERWYAAHYWPWKRAVVDAILTDLEGARARFDRLVPEDERPPQQPPRGQRAREYEARALAAAALSWAGASTRQVAAALDVALI